MADNIVYQAQKALVLRWHRGDIPSLKNQVRFNEIKKKYYLEKTNTSRLNELICRLNELISRLNEIISRLNELISRLNKIISRLNEIISRLNEIISRLNELISRLNELISRLNDIIDNSEPVASVNTLYIDGVQSRANGTR